MSQAGSFKDKVDSMLGVLIPAFGQKVHYRPLTGGSFEINAVFDREGLQIDPNNEALVASSNPAIGIRLRDLARPPVQGDVVMIGAEKFKVETPIPDGQGGSTLLLTRLSK